MNNHCKRVLTSLLIVPKCPGVVWHPKSYVLGFYSFLVPNLSKSCPYFHEILIFKWCQTANFEDVWNDLCALKLFAESRNYFYFFLKSRYILPLYFKAKKQRFGLKFSSLRKNMCPAWVRISALLENITCYGHIFFLRGEISNPNLCFFALKYKGVQ